MALPTEEQIEAAIKDAELAFWAEIAKAFPEVQSGEIDPGESQYRGLVNHGHVVMWLGNNHPELSSDDDLYETWLDSVR